MFGIFAVFPNVFAQLYEIGIREKIDNSISIVEGQVIESKCYKGNNGEIYTAHKLKIYKVFKGSPHDEFATIITMGGWMTDQIRSWTHLLTLEVGDAGIFFLSTTTRPFFQHSNFPKEQFEVYASSQGFLKYSFEEGKVATAPFCSYGNIESQLFEVFSERTGIERKDISTPSWESPYFRNDEENCIIYKFDVGNLVPVAEGFELSTDVYVRMSSDSAYLSQSAIVASYDTLSLGSNIIQSGVLEVESVGISSETNYEIVATDLAPNKVEIKIKAISYDAVSSLVELTTTYQQLAKLKLSLFEIADPGIFLDYSTMEDKSELYNPSTQRPESFKCLKIEGDFEFACSPPVITSFSPSPPDFIRAGTDDTLTIRGMCFDSIRGSSEVEFTNSKAGPMPVDWIKPLDGEYIYWSDTLIKVIVPSIVKGMDIRSSAGTGRFRVNRGAAGTATSPLDLNVRFAALNFGSGPFSKPPNKGILVSLSDYNGLGGQSIYYASNFKADTNSINAFERALIKWKCTTFVNYAVQDSAAVPDINRAGRIEFANLPVGVTTTLAATDNIPYIPCVDVDTILRANRRSFVIKFNGNLSWHTSTSTPSPLPANTFDLESRALHELGHAHLLNHSNEPNDLMYFTDLTPPYRREIEANDSIGGVYIMSISTTPALTGCQSEMVSLGPADCGSATNVIEIANNIQLSAAVYPNPTTSDLNISIEGDTEILNKATFNAILFDLLGREVSSIQIQNETSQLKMSDVPNGFYILSLYFEGKPVKSFKVQKQ
jgi:hypothetical protein